MTILIIEDDRQVAASLKKGLQEQDYAVTVATCAEDARNRLSTGSFDLVILDLGLPDQDGIAFLQELRTGDHRIPVLILTARDSVDARVLGLEQGADDYLVKPFAFSELSARVMALLRRAEGSEPTTLRVEDLTLDLISRIASRGDHEIELRPREFDLLAYLARNKGKAVSREMLTCEVWKIQSRATPMDNIIDVHISHVRQAVDKDFENKLLHTVRGVGFRLGAAE